MLPWISAITKNHKKVVIALSLKIEPLNNKLPSLNLNQSSNTLFAILDDNYFKEITKMTVMVPMFNIETCSNLQQKVTTPKIRSISNLSMLSANMQKKSMNIDLFKFPLDSCFTCHEHFRIFSFRLAFSKRTETTSYPLQFTGLRNSLTQKITS